MKSKLTSAEAALAKPLMKIFFAQQYHVEGCEGDRDECSGCIQEKAAMAKLQDIDTGMYEEMISQGCSF